MTRRRLLQDAIFALIVALVFNEWRLEKDRPRIAESDRNFTVRVATKKFGVGPVEYIYISRADNLMRIGRSLAGAGCVLTGIWLDRSSSR